MTTRRVAKFKGCSGTVRSTLAQLLERRKPRHGAFGTRRNERYLIYLPGQCFNRPYAASIEGAKARGIKLCREHGKAQFNVQNQVTGSILTFDVLSVGGAE